MSSGYDPIIAVAGIGYVGLSIAVLLAQRHITDAGYRDDRIVTAAHFLAILLKYDIF